jgi:hypothetical protein
MAGGRSVCGGFGAFVVTFALAFLPAREAAALDVGPNPTGAPPVQVHGFVSPGFILTTNNNYLAKSSKGSFEFNEVGLNVTAPVTDKLRAGMQLFARDLGPNGNYSFKADWFYLDYRFEDWLGFRAGRIKIPFGLYNEIVDVDAARVPILLPPSVYPLIGRDYLLAQTGIELYGRIDLRHAGALEYRHYVGTTFIDKGEQSTTTTPVTNIDVPFVAGERFIWETPVEGLRAAGSIEALRFELDARIGNQPLNVTIPGFLWIGSLEYAYEDLMLAAEYSRWRLGLVSSIPALLPQQSQQVEQERAYVMASYRIGKVQPGVYYSSFVPDVRSRTATIASSQHDVAATLRFDINSWWLLKLEGHYVTGTADLSSSLNDNKPLTSLERRWGMFLAKTTVHF